VIGITNAAQRESSSTETCQRPQDLTALKEKKKCKISNIEFPTPN
jgi:hypothetical protein